MRVSSGVPGFDALVQGGIPKAVAIVVQGPAGQEKDTFLFQFIVEGLSRGGAALVVLSSGSGETFRADLRSAGVDVDQAIEENRLKFVDWFSYNEEPVQDIQVEGPTFKVSIDLANVGIAISRAIASLPRDKELRAAVEVLSSALSIYELQNVYGFAQSTKAKLERYGFTSLFVLDKDMHDERTVSSIHQPFDGVVDIERTREGDRLVRKVAVLSLKGTTAESTYVPLEIGSDNRLRVFAMSEEERRFRTDILRALGDQGGATQARERAMLPTRKKDEATSRPPSDVDRALARNPRDPDALFARAATLAKGRDAAAAMDKLQLLASIDDAYPGLWIFMAKLHARLGDEDEARRALVRSREVERRREQPLRESEGSTRMDSAMEYACPSCGAAVHEEDTACPTCGVPFDANEKTVAKAASSRPEPETADRGPASAPLERTGHGAGLTNGLASRTRGRTNGLANGLRSVRLGMTNGLTNGSGFTNGLGSARFRRETLGSRWKLYIIPILAAVFLTLPLLGPSPSPGRGPIAIDGNASDWPPALVHEQSRGGPNPNVDIARFGIADNVYGLAILIEVVGSALQGGGTPPTMDAFHVFLDTDGDAGTGYRVEGLGADRLVRISGWGGGVNVIRMTWWDGIYDSTDWRGWTDAASVHVVTAAVDGRIETQLDWPHLENAKGTAFATVQARGFDGATDRADFALNVGGGSLVVRQVPVVPGTVTTTGAQLMRLEVTAIRTAARWSGITITLTGSAPFSATTQLRLFDSVGGLVDMRTPADRRVPFQFAERTIPTGATETFYVVAETLGPSGATVGALVGNAQDVVVSGSVATLLRQAATNDVGYLGSAPADPRVDGGYDEWTSLGIDPVGDATRPNRPDVDVAGFAVQSRGNESFFFAQVTGRFFGGTWVVEPNGLATPDASRTVDSDRDQVPDAVDPLPLDFNNDGIPNADSGGDIDADGIPDYGGPGGTDIWLNATIPATFPAPYAGRTVNVYIGPVEKPFHSRDDILRVFADLDNASSSGYFVGGLGADRMIELAGSSGVVRSAGVFSFTGAFPGEWSWLRTGDASFALGFNRTEFASPENVTRSGSRIYVEIAEAMGGRDTHDAGTRGMRGSPELAPKSPRQVDKSSFDEAPWPTRAPWETSPGTRASTLVDANSNGITAQYNHQRKVVRAGDVVSDSACDATNSDGCWYSVFYDPLAEAMSNTTASTETITTGTKVAGTFPADIQTQNDVYVQYREATDAVNAEIGYRSATGTNGVNSPKSRTWSGAAWGAESELTTAGSPLRSVRMAWSPVLPTQRIFATLSDDGFLDAYVCDTTCTTTNNIGQVWSAAPSSAAIPLDVAYESTSGEALLAFGVFSTNTSRDIAYRTYTSGAWSAEQYLDDAGEGTDLQYSQIKLASKRGSNRIGLVGGDETNNDVNAWIWDGSAFGSFVEVTANGNGADQDRVGIAWESASGDLLAVAGSGSSIVSREFTTGWGATSSFQCSQTGVASLSLKSNPLPTANDMVVATGDYITDVNTCYWTGSAWANWIIHTFTGDSATTRAYDFAWEDSGSKGLLVWGEVGGVNYRTFTAPNTWSGTTITFMGVNPHPWIQLRTNTLFASGNMKILGAVLESAVNDLGAIRWDGTTFTVIGTSTFTANTGTSAYESFELEFQPSHEYEMLVKYDWTGVPVEDGYTLQVKAYRQDENVNVQVLTPASTWNTRITISATTNTLHTYTLTSAEYNGGAPSVRFVDASGKDGTQSDLWVDYANVVSNRHWDRVIIMRSSDTSGSTWGSQVILASGRAADTPRVLTRDSTEPSIAIDSGGFLQVVWVSASAPGEQDTINLVRHTKTTVAYPTEGELANGANWEAVTNVDDANPGYMPTVSTDTNNAPHVAWSGSKTSGTVYYRNKVGGAWKPTVSWGTTYTGLSVDVSPQNNYVSLVRATGSWYNGSWQFRKQITIDRNKVGGTVTDFPVLISRTDTNLQSSAQADGDDILFTSSDGTTKLRHEIEKYVSGTGELVAFVKLPSLSPSADTVLYMYYGNAAAASQQDAANVWDTNFKGVWHVKEATGATNVDSTVNANNGTPTNGPASTTGKIDGALSFDGVNDYVTAGDTASLSTGDIDFTITAWFYMNSKAVSGNRNVIVSKWDNSGGAQQEYLLNYDNGSDRLAFEVKGTTANAINTGSPLIGTWYFVAGRHDAASDAISIFINGLLDTSVACVNCGQDTAHPFEIGRPGANANFFHGLIDEVRMSKVARSAAWIQTQYNNQDSPATFYIVSGEERPFEVRYTVCKNLAVSNCDATAEFTKADGTVVGYDTVATVVETASYPSLATTWAIGDLWVAYAKDVDGTTRAVYARFLDYPGATWAAAETVDSLSGTIFTRPSIGIDKDNNVHALYMATSGPQLYYNKRTGGSWGTRSAVDTTSDNPTLMVRAPDNATYGADAGGLYWKTSSSETYFFYQTTSIPEFEAIAVPILGILFLAWVQRRRILKGREAKPAVPQGAGVPRP